MSYASEMHLTENCDLMSSLLDATLKIVWKLTERLADDYCPILKDVVRPSPLSFHVFRDFGREKHGTNPEQQISHWRS
jgi:hypothetical protein